MMFLLFKDVLEEQVHVDMGTLLILQRSCFALIRATVG